MHADIALLARRARTLNAVYVALVLGAALVVAAESLRRGGLHILLIELFSVPALLHAALAVCLAHAVVRRGRWHVAAVAHLALFLVLWVSLAFIYLAGAVQSSRLDLLILASVAALLGACNLGGAILFVRLKRARQS